MKNEFFVIVHNVRSAHNVGSIFRTADGAGVGRIYISGYSPSPAAEKSIYLKQAEKMLAKTALGAEKTIQWKRAGKIGNLLANLKKEKFEIVALEQSDISINYRKFRPQGRLVLIVGNEAKGIDKRILKKCDAIVEIPMMGEKNSLNVAVAFGVAAYEIRSKIK